MGVNCLLVAYKDTGTFVFLINTAFVDSSAYTGDVMEVWGIFGPPIKTPTAKIQVKSPKFQFDGYVTVEVEVVDTKLPFGAHVLLGNGIYLHNRDICDIICVRGKQFEFVSSGQPLGQQLVGAVNADVSGSELVSDPPSDVTDESRQDVRFNAICTQAFAC